MGNVVIYEEAMETLLVEEKNIDLHKYFRKFNKSDYKNPNIRRNRKNMKWDKGFILI